MSFCDQCQSAFHGSEKLCYFSKGSQEDPFHLWAEHKKGRWFQLELEHQTCSLMLDPVPISRWSPTHPHQIYPKPTVATVATPDFSTARKWKSLGRSPGQHLPVLWLAQLSPPSLGLPSPDRRDTSNQHDPKGVWLLAENEGERPYTGLLSLLSDFKHQVPCYTVLGGSWGSPLSCPQQSQGEHECFWGQQSRDRAVPRGKSCPACSLDTLPLLCALLPACLPLWGKGQSLWDVHPFFSH